MASLSIAEIWTKSFLILTKSFLILTKSFLILTKSFLILKSDVNKNFKFDYSYLINTMTEIIFINHF